MATFLHESPDGRLIEYRRFPVDPKILFLQARELRRDGYPHDDRWYPVSDKELLRLNTHHNDLLTLLVS